MKPGVIPDNSGDDLGLEEHAAYRRPKRRPPQRHGTSIESTLPVWLVTAGSKSGTLNIECPRKECGGKCVVSRRWLNSRPGFIGRSCTYCFKVARLPEAS